MSGCKTISQNLHYKDATLHRIKLYPEFEDPYIELWIAVVNRIFDDITSNNKTVMPYERRLDIVKTMLNGGFDWLNIDGRKLLTRWFKSNQKYYEWYKEDIKEWINL